MPSIGGAYIPVDPDALTSGEATFARPLAYTTITQTNQSLSLAYFTARKTEAITSVRVLVGSTAAGATPTLVRFGIYTVASNGDLTLAASTANDTALLATPSAAESKALSATFNKSAGQRLAFGVLVVTGATAPTLRATTVTAISSEAGVAPRLCGLVSGQADLPASVASGSVSALSAAPYGVLVP